MEFGKVTKDIKTASGLEAKGIVFIVPQVTTVEELVSFYGSGAELVSRMNKVIARSAPQSSLLRLSKLDTTDPAELQAEITKEINNTKDYTPEVGGGFSKNAKADAVDKVLALATTDRARFDAMSKDELLALLSGQAV